MGDFKTLKLYAQNKKLPKVVKLGIVHDSWLKYAYQYASGLKNTSDFALEQRSALNIKGTEVDDYESLTGFYNQRYVSNISLPEEVKKLEGVHHLRFGVLERNGTIPFHLDEPYTLRFICMIHGTHRYHVETGETYDMAAGELWYINGSYKHSIENTSEHQRIALLGKFERNDNNINELLRTCSL